MAPQSGESKVLVIYTGGTIGMLVGPQGFVPEPFFLTETLRSQNRFHDPFEDSLFSHSNSVKGFREWSSFRSGPSSPTAEHSPQSRSMSPGPDGGSNPTSDSILRPLPVRSSRPIGPFDHLDPSGLRSSTTRHTACKKLSDDVYEAQLPSLVTPKITIHSGAAKRVRYAVLEWDPLLDSSNVDMDDWIRIATEIELNYLNFDAFVVLHGTDTMAYTSSALSFLLENLGKTVIVTGAQIPLSQLRNDAVDNLLGALTIAGHYIIPECSLYFNHTLFRGNRVVKSSSYDLNAFSSPNFAPLVNVGIDITVNWNDVLRQKSISRFIAHKTLEANVATLRLFPGITAATVRAFLAPSVRGVVLETFGSGNAPQRADLMQSLKDACGRGVVIVAITQCVKGSVSDAYETGRTLLQAGVVAGHDMTPECALAKLSYLLAKPEFDPARVRELISTPLRGELTLPSGSAVPHPTINQTLDSIQNVVSRISRLSFIVTSPAAAVAPPQITLSGPSSPGPDTGVEAHSAAASWTWTAGEAQSTEASLLPYLVHLAAAKDDVESMTYCLESPSTDVSSLVDNRTRTVGGGIVNCLEPTSGRSPLHVVALNGSPNCLRLLLESGALVHLRDILGHTALYYAARQGHEDLVDMLVAAGANLSGSDIAGGFVLLEVNNAERSRDEKALRIWKKLGFGMKA